MFSVQCFQLPATPSDTIIEHTTYPVAFLKKLKSRLVKKTIASSLCLIILIFSQTLFSEVLRNPGSQVLPVFYIGEKDILHERLFLDPLVQESNDFESSKSVFIYNREIEPELLEKIKTRVKAGELGLVVNLGSNISQEFLSSLLEMEVTIEHLSTKDVVSEGSSYGESIAWFGLQKHPLATQVAWKSAVQVQERTQILLPKSLAERYQILAATGMHQTLNSETQNFQEAILIEVYLGKGKIYILNPWFKRGNDAQRLEHIWSALIIKNEDAFNYVFYNWAYFNWILNFLVHDAAGVPSATFSNWPYAPIPQDSDIVILTICIITILLFSILLFLWVRKNSLAHPEVLERIRLADYEQIRSGNLAKIKTKIASSRGVERYFRKIYYRMANFVLSEISEQGTRWEKIGFIRPLAGFQMVVSYIYLGVLPILIFATLMLNYVAPFPQSIGMTSWVSGAFALLFTLFDLGTGIAMIKFFAEYRVKDPAKAMQYVQFYIWFQLISGIIQVALLAIATAHMAEDTAYAFLSWIIIFKVLTQFPGFAAVFHNIFRALQRYDLMILTIVVPLPFSALVSFFGMIWIRSWSLGSPAYGEIMGLSLGDIVPAFVASWVYIFASLFIYKSLGFSLRATFSAHFDRTVISNSLNYGLRYTPGALAPMLSGFALPIILSLWLNNYLELNSMLTIALWINFLIRGPGYMLYSNLLPSISEAFSHQRKILSSHYIDQALKWSLMFVCGVLPYFIVLGKDVAAAIMPEQWAGASQYIALAVIFGSIEFLSALPDEAFKGAGKPQLFTAVNVFDHLLRVILMLLLIPHYAIYGVLYAFIIASATRCLISWYLLSHHILKLEISWWQTVIVPILVSLLVFVIAVLITLFYQVNSPKEALPLVLVFFIISPMFYFFAALLGGFDDENLQEFRDSLKYNIVTRWIGWIAFLPAKFGAQLSPLHGKFPMKNWQLAQKEAASLNDEKVNF